MPVSINVRQSTTTSAAVEIPASVVKEVEQLYAELSKAPGSEAAIVFKDQDERLQWTAQARAYCSTREKGALKLRQLPSKNLPENEARFSITANLPENGARNGRK